MFKRNCILLAAGLILSLVPIFVSSKTEDSFTMPAKYASMVGDYRKNFAQVTGYEYSGLHWKQYVIIYMNKGASIYENNYLSYITHYLADDEDEEEEDEEAEEEYDFRPYEKGTIFLKEHFADAGRKPGQPLTTVLMVKREPGYDKEGGDWEYVQATNDGKIIMSGNSKDTNIRESCQKCHANMAERDYVFSTFYSARFGKKE